MSSSHSASMRPLFVNTLKRIAPLIWCVITLGAVYILVTRLKGFTLHEVASALLEVPATRLAIATLYCLVSYAILSGYEVLAVRHVTGRLLVRIACITSWISHSIGHVLGAALLSGGALRYRRYAAARLSATDVGAVTILSAMPYVLAAGWLLDAAFLLFTDDAARALHLPAAAIVALGWIGLLKDFGWLAVVARRRVLRIGSWSLPLPGLGLTVVQIIVGVLEVGLAASILFVLMPAELQLSLAAFIGVFLIAATAAQVSHVPAGLGVLEAALLVMLPEVPPTKLLAAVLCYRAVFELLPLLIGIVLLVHAELRPTPATTEEHFA